MENTFLVLEGVCRGYSPAALPGDQPGQSLNGRMLDHPKEKLLVAITKGLLAFSTVRVSKWVDSQTSL